MSVLADLVHQKIADELKTGKYFTVMVDGTTDKSGQEIQGLVVRFYSEKKESLVEKALAIGSSGRSAQEIFEFVKNSFEKYGLTFDGLVSQAYDGASVMSGIRGGLQAILSNFCQRVILYIHCFAHKLNLVIKNVVQNIDELRVFFDTLSAIYTFFKLSNVSESYEGTSIKRLIDTRWSGHMESSKSIKDNYSEIKEALEISTTNRKLDSGQRALAHGLLSQIKEFQFICLTCYVVKVLGLLDILNKILQSSKESIVSAMTVVKSTRKDLKSLRNEISGTQIEVVVDEFCKNNNVNQCKKNGRKHSRPSNLSDYTITDYIPSEKKSNELQIITEFLDMLDEDFETRFSEENSAVWVSMYALVPGASKFLDCDSLKPLFLYMKNTPIWSADKTSVLSFDDLKAECSVFKRVLSYVDLKTFENNRNEIDICKVTTYMLKNYRDIAPILCNMYLIAITAGFASARVECLFSSLTGIDTPQRRSMTTDREADLTYLYFESKTLQSLIFDDFLRKWRNKPRKLCFD